MAVSMSLAEQPETPAAARSADRTSAKRSSELGRVRWFFMCVVLSSEALIRDAPRMKRTLRRPCVRVGRTRIGTTRRFIVGENSHSARPPFRS